MPNRFEYYWENGRIVEYENHHSGHGGPWPMGPHDHDDLIAAVRTVNSHNQLTFGPQATPDRVARALVRFSRHDCDPNTPEIGQSIPGELLHNVSQHVKTLTEMLVDEYIAVGNEVAQSGLFAGVLNSGKVFQFGEWEATIRAQVFSSETKEPKVGADMGIIVDVRRGNDRVVKGSLIQAKREEGWQGDVNKLPRFVGQAKKMQETTHESYGMIFSPDDSYIFSPENPQERIPLDRFFADQLRCRRGDRNPEAVAQAYDQSIVIDMTVATGANR